MLSEADEEHRAWAEGIEPKGESVEQPGVKEDRSWWSLKRKGTVSYGRFEKRNRGLK